MRCKILNKLFTFVLFWSACITALAQEVDYSIREIRVKANLQSFYQDDTQRYEIDSLIVGNSSFLSLSDVFEAQGGIVISSYGSRGSLAGLKLRGTGDNHTRFHWNGIPMNSITAGGMDASLVPAGFMQNVYLTKGASGVLAGNASFGGAVYLNNNPDWNKKLDVSLASEIGSFGYRAIMPAITVSSKNVQYRASFQKIKADNDFKYKDIYKAGQPVNKQINDTLFQQGLIQNLFFRFNRGLNIDLGLWIQEKSKDIPPVMGSYKVSPASQTDKSVKAYVKLIKLFNSSRLQVQLGYLNDSLSYMQLSADNPENILLDSRIQSRSIISKTEWRWFVNNNFTMDFGVHSEHPSAIVDNYGSRKSENRLSLISAAKYRYKSLVANFGLRKEFNPYNPPRPLASAGLSWKSNEGYHLVRFNISNKFRIPTFNERYWQPGGNLGLLPEDGWGSEIGWKWNAIIGDDFRHELEPVFFYQRINNWIQWVPSAGYWHPINQDLLISKGFEVNGSLKSNIRFANTEFIYKYSYTDARKSVVGIDQEATHIIYVPRHQSLIGFSLNLGGFRLGINYQFLSPRHTSSDLNPLYKLESVHLVNLNTSYTHNLNDLQFEIFGRLNNIGNYYYQMIRSYAAPGISASIGMKINFKKINQEQ